MEPSLVMRLEESIPFLCMKQGEHFHVLFFDSIQKQFQRWLILVRMES